MRKNLKGNSGAKGLKLYECSILINQLLKLYKFNNRQLCYTTLKHTQQQCQLQRQHKYKETTNAHKNTALTFRRIQSPVSMDKTENGL